MTPASDSDEALLARITRHDQDALQELLGRYYLRLGEVSFALLHHRDLAEEAVSNVFLNIWRRRETLVIKTNVRSYLFASVTNQARTLRRSRLPRDTIGLDDVPPAELADAHRTDAAILYREFRDEIDALIEKMPPQRQRIFRMNRIEGLRYGEIAQALSISEHTVQNHMVQAMKQLVAELPRLRSALERSTSSHPFD